MGRTGLLCVLMAVVSVAQQELPGYDDTPVLRALNGVELPWRVHDRNRPRPVRIDAAKCVEVPPPADAVVLFNGKDLAQWRSGDKPAAWKLQNGVMGAQGGDLRTTESFGDIQLHLEWRSPPDDPGSGQQRGNSGVFLMDRYEVQVLESSSSLTYPDGQAGALYGQWPPLVNACAALDEWNSYDICFRAPRFSGKGELAAPATVTVLHNGIVIHAQREFLGATAHRTLPRYSAHGAAPLRLQDHGDAVAFRNIWLRRLDVETPR